MPNRIRWTDRTFDFSEPADLYPELIERARSGPLRARALAASATTEALTRRDGDTWSIQENIAHIAELDETLFIPRIEQIIRGEARLKPADMSNRATHQSNYNAEPIDAILERFDDVRGRVLRRLESLPPDAFARASLHPRLETPMRLVDLIRFKCEHDDYHFARIRELMGRWGVVPPLG